jgi:hypothetical protein
MEAGNSPDDADVPPSLAAIPYLDQERIAVLQGHARASVASLTGPGAEQLLRDQVRQVRAAQVQHQRREALLVRTYGQLPGRNHLHTIKGIGEVTAAVLTAYILSIDRFPTAAKLVGYFGTFPVEESSGIDRDGQRRASQRMVMSPRGGDWVRSYLYNAALWAAQHNPAVRPLYQRVRVKHPDHPSIAVGHARCQLLHLVFAVWKSGRPFNPAHYPWADAAPREGTDPPRSSAEQAAGHNPETKPEKSVVTAAGSDGGSVPPGSHAAPDTARSPTPPPNPAAPSWVSFAPVRAQLPLRRVLEHLHCFDALRGRTSQRRGPCPLHSPQAGRTFSVHLDRNVFQCFDPAGGIKGDVIDRWAAVPNLTLRDAALGLVRTCALGPAPPAPRPGTEKRNG